MNKVACCLLCFLLIAAPAVAEEGPDEERQANGYDNDSVPSSQTGEKIMERFVEVRSEQDHVHEIESKTVNTTSGKESKFQIEIRAKETLEIKLKNEQEIVDDEVQHPGNVSEVSVVFDKLVAYRDANDNNEYNSGEPALSHELEGYRQLESTTYTQNNDTIHRITATTSDGIFQVVFYATGGFAEIGSTVVEPTETKFDIRIRNFTVDINRSEHANNRTIPANNSSTVDSNATLPEPKIALDMDIETNKEVSQSKDETEEIIRAKTDGRFHGFVSWRNKAIVDGEETAVNATRHDESVYLSYGTGTTVVHDPKAGFVPAPSSKSPGEGGLLAFLADIIGSLLQVLF